MDTPHAPDFLPTDLELGASEDGAYNPADWCDDEIGRNYLRNLSNLGIKSTAAAAVGRSSNSFYMRARRDERFRQGQELAMSLGGTRIVGKASHNVWRGLQSQNLTVALAAAKYALEKYDPLSGELSLRGCAARSAGVESGQPMSDAPAHLDNLSDEEFASSAKRAVDNLLTSMRHAGIDTA